MEDSILFRISDRESVQELEIASQYFPVYKTRCGLPKKSRVIARYSCLPYFKELEEDLRINGSKLVNNWEQFQYIANFDYYEDLADFTFETWFGDFGQIPYDDEGPFVLKGRTNSKKRKWKELMFAPNRQRAIEIYCKLLDDDMISAQGVIIRRYEELEELGRSEITGQPFTNEWRFFYYKGKILSYDYYWSIANPETINSAKIDQSGLDFAQKIGTIVREKTNFYVADIARRKDGVWRLVELNDGMMSGINIEKCNEMYSNLKKEMSSGY